MPLQTSPWIALARRAPVALACLCLALVALAPRSAFAQTITQTMGTSVLDYLPASAGGGGGPSTHPNNVDATWISYSDCENNVQIYVPVSVTVPANGFAGYNVAAYATTVTGTDCGQPTSHSGATGVCWSVELSPGVFTGVPVQAVTYEVPVRDILRNIGAAAGIGLNQVAGTEAACHVAAQSGAIPISLQFVIADNGGNEDSNLQIGLNAELIGPAPPTGITLGVGEGLLKLSWTPVSDPTTQGFNIFIDPLPGHEGQSADAAAEEASTSTGDASEGTMVVCADAGFLDGGVDEADAPIEIPIDGGMCHTVTIREASAAQTSACPSTILTSGVTGVVDSGTTVPIPTSLDSSIGVDTTDAAFTPVVSGTAPTAAQLAQLDTMAQVGGGTQTSATIKGLKDGYVYTVAIAAIDNLNDNGPLSTPYCATPSPINDFYEQYRADGGLAGGSFCALEGVGIPAGTGAFGVVMVGACLALARRRRRS